MIRSTKVVLTVIVTSLFMSATISSTTVAQEIELEKCFGIVLKGLDDGMGSGPNEDIPGSSTVNFDGNAYKFVKKNTCVTISTPFGLGSLKPLNDRPPKS